MIIPYFSQWASSHRIQDFSPHGAESPQNDPLWASTGAVTPEEYSFWVDHICGMACLKMIMAYARGKELPLIDLAKACSKFGGYRLLSDGKIKGLYYKPFVKFVSCAFGLKAEMCIKYPPSEILNKVKSGFFIASVHPWIRNPESAPPSRGGHLVLLFHNDKNPEKLMFHNPSGFTKETQEYVEMDVELFDKFYAQQGIFVRYPALKKVSKSSLCKENGKWKALLRGRHAALIPIFFKEVFHQIADSLRKKKPASPRLQKRAKNNARP